MPDTNEQYKELAGKIEAILFFKAEPLSVRQLSKSLGVSGSDILNAAQYLIRSLEGRGITLIESRPREGKGQTPEDRIDAQNNETLYELRTAQNQSALIEQITREELVRDIGKAGLETLAIILYKSPVARREIDYIRGVNSQFILRNLLMRRLIERQTSPTDQRSFVYIPTPDLLGYLGLNKIEDLPDFENYRQKIESIEKAAVEEGQGS